MDNVKLSGYINGYIMAVNNNSNLVNIVTDSGTAVISTSQPSFSIVGGTSVSTAAATNTITITGTGGSGSNWNFISSASLASITGATQTGIDVYDEVMLVFNNIVCAVGAPIIYVKISNDGGSTWDNMTWGVYSYPNVATIDGAVGTSDSFTIIQMSTAGTYGSVNGRAIISGNLLAKKKVISSRLETYVPGFTFQNYHGQAITASTTTYDAIRAEGSLFFSAGTVEFWGR